MLKKGTLEDGRQAGHIDNKRVHANDPCISLGLGLGVCNGVVGGAGLLRKTGERPGDRGHFINAVIFDLVY